MRNIRDSAMKLLQIALLVAMFSRPLLSQGKISYDDYFTGDAMRIDLYIVADAKEEIITLDRVHREGRWPGNPENLIEPLNYGRYGIKVYDIASNVLICSHGFDAMVGEYRTTTPALNGTKRTFERSVRIPFAKRPILLVIEERDKQNVLRPLHSVTVDPAGVSVVKETVISEGTVVEVLKSGESRRKVDLAFLSEGYTRGDSAKFIADVHRFADLLFGVEPYKSRKGSFNVVGVFHPSAEDGMDEPRQGVFKKTLFNSSFNTFGVDRYLLTEENKLLREIAAQVPYDALVILVNSKRYGGGGIYHDYCISTVDNTLSGKVFVHEFGHSFAGLGDEYYTSDVAYNDLYPKGVEPLEPNITALLDTARIKWGALLSPGIDVPTNHGKGQLDSLQEERRKNGGEMRKETESARRTKASDSDLKAIGHKYREKEKEIDRRIEAVRARYAHVKGKVGVFEGAGYSSKGLYRPMVECLMFSNSGEEFCRVCRNAIETMIDLHCGK